MLGRAEIATLIPHQGAMCLLERVVSWDDRAIVCCSRTHLDPRNPLRRDGLLGAVCGVEYGMQAAALHGALREGLRQPAGHLVGLRDVQLEIGRLDDHALGTLHIDASLELRGAGGLIYNFRIASEAGRVLLAGRATIMQTARSE